MALADDITLLEKKVHQLKVDYDQYFSGMQKLAPEKLRNEVDKMLRTLTSQKSQNTAQNFRLSTITAKYNSYKTMWDRTLREIEEGRFVREIKRAQVHARLSTPPPPSQTQKSVNSGTPAPGEEDGMQKIYKELAAARQKTGEAPVKFDSVADLIKKQTPLLKEKFKGAAVEFKVVIEDGKAKLRAEPKK